MKDFAANSLINSSLIYYKFIQTKSNLALKSFITFQQHVDTVFIILIFVLYQITKILTPYFFSLRPNVELFGTSPRVERQEETSNDVMETSLNVTETSLNVMETSTDETLSSLMSGVRLTSSPSGTMTRPSVQEYASGMYSMLQCTGVYLRNVLYAPVYRSILRYILYAPVYRSTLRVHPVYRSIPQVCTLCSSVQE